MSNSLLATVVIAGIVGASSAAVTASLLAPSPAAGNGPELASKAELAVPDLAPEVAALRKQNADLSDRLMELELQISVASNETRREPIAVDVDPEMAGMKQELAALLASMKGASASVPPAFTETVSTALAEIREQEDAERQQRREERRLERADERLNELTEKLGLNPTQVNDMREFMTSFDAKRQALFTEAREAGDFGSMRESMRAMRTEQETALQSILSPAQYQQYEDEDLGGGFGGGRGRGGFGGGGGGGGDAGGGGGGGRGGRGGF